MAAVPAVSVKFRGPRTSVLGFLVIGSVFVVFWKWDSLSWHARGMILAAYGVVCLGAGLIPALRTRGLLESGAQAQGTVVDVERDTSGGSGTTYNPVVRFTAADGRTVEFTSAVGYSRSPDIGGAVPVRYRPGDPEQAEIDRATMWMIPAAFGLVGGLGLLVAAVIVYSSQVSKAAPTAAPVTSPPSPAATSTITPSAASTTPGSSPVNRTPGTGRLGAKVVPAPSAFTLSPDVHNGPISRADFNQYWGDPASLHFARGYDVTYDSNDASDSIEVTLFQFATPADAAAFKADYVLGIPVKPKADPVIPGADDYDSTSPDQGTYTHDVIATKGNRAFVIEDINVSAAPVPLVETMARQQYAAL
jgi:Protein of unknown function (DUF3592)